MAQDLNLKAGIIVTADTRPAKAALDKFNSHIDAYQRKRLADEKKLKADTESRYRMIAKHEQRQKDLFYKDQQRREKLQQTQKQAEDARRRSQIQADNNQWRKNHEQQLKLNRAKKDAADAEFLRESRGLYRLHKQRQAQARQLEASQAAAQKRTLRDVLQRRTAEVREARKSAAEDRRLGVAHYRAIEHDRLRSMRQSRAVEASQTRYNRARTRFGGMSMSLGAHSAGAGGTFSAMTGLTAAAFGAISPLAGLAAIIVGLGIAAGAAAVKFSDAVAKWEELKIKAGVASRNDSDKRGYSGVRSDTVSTGLKYGLSIRDLQEGVTASKIKGIDLNSEQLAAIQIRAQMEDRTLRSAMEAIEDATTGMFVRLKEYGIKGKANKSTGEYTFRNVTTGEVAKVNNKDSDKMREILVAMMEKAAKPFLEARKGSLAASMMNVQNAGNLGTTNIFEGALAPLKRAWDRFSNQLLTTLQNPEVQKALRSFGQFLGTTVEALFALGEFLYKVFSPIILKIRDGFGALGTALEVIFALFISLTQYWNASEKDKLEKWRIFTEVVRSSFSIIYSAIMTAAYDTASAFLNAFADVRDFILKMVDAIGPVIESYGPKIAEAIVNAATFGAYDIGKGLVEASGITRNNTSNTSNNSNVSNTTNVNMTGTGSPMSAANTFNNRIYSHR